MSTNTYKLQRTVFATPKSHNLVNGKPTITNYKSIQTSIAININITNTLEQCTHQIYKAAHQNSHISNPTKQQLIQPINGHPETHLRIVQIKFKTIYEVHKAYNNTKIPKLIPITFFQTKAQIALVNTTSNTTTPKSPTRSNVHTHKHYKKLKSKSINTHPKLQQTKAKKLSTCIVKAHCTHQVTSLSNAYKRRNNMNYTTNQICKSSGTIIHKLLKLLCNPHASSTKRQQYYIYRNNTSKPLFSVYWLQLYHTQHHEVAQTPPRVIASVLPVLINLNSISKPIQTHARKQPRSRTPKIYTNQRINTHKCLTTSASTNSQQFYAIQQIPTTSQSVKALTTIHIIYYFPVSQRYILHNIKKSQTNRVTNYNPNNSPDHNNPAKPTYTRTKAYTKQVPNNKYTYKSTYPYPVPTINSQQTQKNRISTNIARRTSSATPPNYCNTSSYRNLIKQRSIQHPSNASSKSTNQFQTKPCIRATLKQYRLYKPTRQNSSNNKPQYGNSSTSFTASNVLTTNTTTLIGSTRKLTHYKLKLKHDKAMSQWHTY
eukprot:gene3186-2168_t